MVGLSLWVMVTLTSMAGVEGDARLHLPPLFFWIYRSSAHIMIER